LDENHPFLNFPPKIEASLGELNPTEIKRLEDKGKRRIFLPYLGFISANEDVEIPESERRMEMVDQKSVGRRIGGEGSSTSTGHGNIEKEITQPSHIFNIWLNHENISIL
jgi:hypothetical protein